MRKYKLNENFFELINSEEKAYFLGFLFADGYVNEKLNMIDLTLHNKDKEILNKFVELLYPEGRPLKIIRINYLRLVINSSVITNDLVKYGCVQAKTFKLKFPQIPENFQRDFIRGYFDGDGSICVSKYNTLNLSIVGTINFLDGIKKILRKKCTLNETIYDDRHPEQQNNIRALRFGGNIIINRIFHYLYDDSIIYLNRKRKIFLSILENKDYFCNVNKIRALEKHLVMYDGQQYNYAQLAKILSIKTKINPRTIRGKLQKGWSINEIIEIPLNYHRNSKRKTVYKMDKNKNVIDKYESVTLAAQSNSCNEGSIYQAINKNKRLQKYYWKYNE